ncbi:hypothetical protein CCP3SC15_670002 [Gammaproteobacteria bacterium]
MINALGRELCFEEYAVARERTVQEEDVDNAAEILILRRDTHIDQLADKLSEPRVAKIIGEILVGEERDEAERSDADTRTTFNEDRQYLLDLGLVRQGAQGLEIANPIYREVIPRELTTYRQDMDRI